jgi:hypothetical protein
MNLILSSHLFQDEAAITNFQVIEREEKTKETKRVLDIVTITIKP